MTIYFAILVVIRWAIHTLSSLKVRSCRTGTAFLLGQVYESCPRTDLRCIFLKIDTTLWIHSVSSREPKVFDIRDEISLTLAQDYLDGVHCPVRSRKTLTKAITKQGQPWSGKKLHDFIVYIHNILIHLGDLTILDKAPIVERAIFAYKYQSRFRPQGFFRTLRDTQSEAPLWSSQLL